MALVTILEELHARLEADDWDALAEQDSDPAQVAQMATALRAMDLYLTGKTMDYANHYEREATKVLSGDVIVLHLADGGYSRLGVRFTERPFLWVDRGASLPRVLNAWDKLEKP